MRLFLENENITLKVGSRPGFGDDEVFKKQILTAELSRPGILMSGTFTKVLLECVREQVSKNFGSTEFETVTMLHGDYDEAIKNGYRIDRGFVRRSKTYDVNSDDTTRALQLMNSVSSLLSTLYVSCKRDDNERLKEERDAVLEHTEFCFVLVDDAKRVVLTAFDLHAGLSVQVYEPSTEMRSGINKR